MSWTRRVLAVLAVCVLLLTGSVGCGSSDAGEPEAGDSATPVGRLLDATDEEGRSYREVDAEHAPEVGIEVQPAGDDSWDVRLTVRDFRFSPAGTESRAVPGRGLAHLFLDGDLIARLRGPDHRLDADLVPRGTHQLTVRLYADDGTVWAVDGKPVESTADVTASDAEPTEATRPEEIPEGAGSRTPSDPAAAR
ncbi:hypothetical protein [Streptomyces sp. AC602_WCS936]|uniref:hypothetical protein n=1 Tax=Streptomyces sp. AC602_WCS936 TaxID=2823685 RepID=UPI001C267965|nr:hypothetical protein [Streptomyces sp. AC602_WCS936]